jgi:hypothetical protein
VPRSDRNSLIKHVKEPLSYFTLAALIVEAVVGGLAFKLGDKSLAYLAAAVLTLYVIVVAVLAVFKPGALSAQTGTVVNDVFAVGLAEEFYAVVNGYYSNLSPDDRTDAYRFLQKTITTSPHIQTSEQKKFCDTLAGTVIRRANIIDEGRLTK